MDTGMLQFLAAPFAASLILTGIHAYLGVHVVERGVIFVDLSLAQIAALGATIAILMPITNGDHQVHGHPVAERAPEATGIGERGLAGGIGAADGEDHRHAGVVAGGLDVSSQCVLNRP